MTTKFKDKEKLLGQPNWSIWLVHGGFLS